MKEHFAVTIEAPADGVTDCTSAIKDGRTAVEEFGAVLLFLEPGVYPLATTLENPPPMAGP